MKPIRHLPKKTGIGLFLIWWAVVGLGCGGGGGGDTSPSRKVTITGSVQIDTGSAAFQEATCRFVDGQGVEYARAAANMLGEYTLAVPPDVEGYVACTPAAFANLALTTYCSTKGLAAGATLEGEAVTIHSTVAAQIMAGENPADPTARKEELLTTMAKGQDPDLNLVAEVAAALYNALLCSNLDLNFTGLTIGDDENEGIEGTVGSGVDGELISDAQCVFIAGDVLSTDQPVLTNAALADFCSDGQLNRADLADIAPSINGDYPYRQEEIIAAFGRVFPEGIGQSYAVTADTAGAYFLAVPANVPGYVRCTPPDQELMMLATYVPGRPEGESLEDQDVNPATTLYALEIATKQIIEGDCQVDDFVMVDIPKSKDNFLKDIAGLDVQMLQENGKVSGFQIRPGTAPADSLVGLPAFCATALYNILYHNSFNVDYLAALDLFFETLVVEPAFLEDQGVAAQEARTAVEILGAAVIQAEETLDTELGTAMSTARINFTVLETPIGPPMPGYDLGIFGYETCYGCDNNTDAQGRVTGVFSILGYSQLDTWYYFQDTIYYATLTPMMTLDISLFLKPHSFVHIGAGAENYDGTGQVTSADGRVDCHIVQGDLIPEYRVEYDESSDNSVYSSCSPYHPPGTTVTLTAVPSANSTFVGWEGAECRGSDPTCTLTADYGQTVTPVFAPICEEQLYQVWPQNMVLDADGGYDFIHDDFPESCDGLVTRTLSDWITILDECEENQCRTVDAGANPNPGPRTGTVMVGEHAVTVAQNGQQCTLQDYYFTPAAPTFEAIGGTSTLQVRAPDHCPWQPVVDADWITLTSDTTEQRGNGTVTYTVAENTGTASREGAISIAGTQMRVGQNNAVSNPPLALAIQGSGEGAGDVTVIRRLPNGPSVEDVYDFGCYVSNGWFSGRCAAIYQPGTTLELQAGTADNAGWIFSNWTGSCSGQLPWCEVTMDQAHAVGACFVPSSQAELTLYKLSNDASAELVMGSTPDYSLGVFNAGVADAESFSVGFYISSDTVITTEDILIPNGRVSVDGLTSRAGMEVSVPEAAWIPTDLTVGPAFLGVIIDETNSVREDIETNNTYAFPIHILSARQSPRTQGQDPKTPSSVQEETENRP